MTDRKETNLEYTLTNLYKDDLISYIESHPYDFTELVKLSISDKQPYSWRATWLLWSCIDNNDKRIRKYIKKFINILPDRQDNQQRELLMVLQRMELDTKYEGQLFDSCTKIWGNINIYFPPSLGQDKYKFKFENNDDAIVNTHIMKTGIYILTFLFPLLTQQKPIRFKFVLKNIGAES